MKKLILIIACISCTACGTFAPKEKDTRTWTNVRCSGLLEWDVCFNQARKLCPQGFDIANKEELRSAQHRAMDVACK